MKSNRKASASLLLASLIIGIFGIDANALTPVAKPTKVAVVTTSTTATITWTAFAKGKVTAVKIVASTGSKKITKTASATAKSFKFTGLYPNASYAFSVYGVKGKVSSAAVVVRAKTKVFLCQRFDDLTKLFNFAHMLIRKHNGHSFRRKGISGIS